jgi:hypothetical protein
MVITIKQKFYYSVEPLKFKKGVDNLNRIKFKFSSDGED